MLGERLAALTDFETLKLIAAAVVLSPFTPLLFMGEEYLDTVPFQYFVSHSDSGLVEAVRSARCQEFAAFAWQGECPDPQDEATFLRSKFSPELCLSGRHAALNGFYTELLRLRRTVPALGAANRSRGRAGPRFPPAMRRSGCSGRHELQPPRRHHTEPRP